MLFRSDKFVNISNNEEYKSILVSSRVLRDNRQFYIKEFDNTYYYNFKSEYRFFKFIEIYVRTRIFDMKTFKKDMEMIINTVDTSNLPGYKRLLTEEYWKISDEEFEPIINEILEDVRTGKTSLIENVKLFIYFDYLINKGLIKNNMQDVKGIFVNGMNISSLVSAYCDNVEDELDTIGIGEPSQDVEDILRHFYNLNSKLKDRMYIEMADSIFKCIPMKMEVFYERFDKECMNIPIFKYYDVYQTFQRLSCASNEDIVTIKEKLVNRADLFTKEIEPEMRNIRQLKQVIDDYVKDKENSIKLVMLKDFSNDLGKILAKYE